MRNRLSSLFVALFAASTFVIVPAASSQTVKVNAVGSSAQWQVDAVAAAVAIQSDLYREPWPADTAIRVRIAVHTGETDLRDGDYYGSLVHVVARSVKVAAESKVVVDEAVADYCRAHGAPIRFSGLGAQKLRGIEEPVLLFVAEPV